MINVEQVVVIGATALLCGCLYALFRYSKLGIAMQAASQNQLAAYYMGIPVKRLNSLAWGLASAVAAIAGLLLAPITFVHANMGFIGLKAFPAAVVGGFGSLPGAIVGGLVIGLVESLAGFYLPEGFKDTAAYIVVLLMLVIKPTGLFGEKLRKKSDMRFIFKTEYDQDIRLVKHGGHLFWYGVLMLLLLAAPWLLAEYWLAQLTFVLIYSLAGLGLMLLAGYTGLFSLGHAAFLGLAPTHRRCSPMPACPLCWPWPARPHCQQQWALSWACRHCGSRASTWASPHCLLALLSKRCWPAGKVSPAVMLACTLKSQFFWLAP